MEDNANAPPINLYGGVCFCEKSRGGSHWLVAISLGRSIAMQIQ